MKTKINTPLLNILLFCSILLAVNKKEEINKIEQKFITAGLVNVQEYDSTIQVNLVNSNKSKNYFNYNFYNGLQKAYFQKDVAIKLKLAQKKLRERYPGYSLLIMDATRPNSVSKAMYEKVKGTKFERYVAHPGKGSMHNFGAAVDITIIDKNKKRVDMGFTPFYKSEWGVMLSYLWSGWRKLNNKQMQNRELLAEVMKSAGFLPLAHEWWHFNGFSKEYIRKTYKMIK